MILPFSIIYYVNSVTLWDGKKEYSFSSQWTVQNYLPKPSQVFQNNFLDLINNKNSVNILCVAS